MLYYVALNPGDIIHQTPSIRIPTKLKKLILTPCKWIMFLCSYVLHRLTVSMLFSLTYVFLLIVSLLTHCRFFLTNIFNKHFYNKISNLI